MSLRSSGLRWLNASSPNLSAAKREVRFAPINRHHQLGAALPKSAASSGNQIGRCSPAAADPLQHLDSANAAGLMLVLASDIDEQLTVNARRSP